MLARLSYALRDDNDLGVNGLPFEGVVRMDSSGEQRAGHVKLQTTVRIERLAPGSGRQARCQIAVTPGANTTALELALLVLCVG